jgi:hypothetical protein
MIFSLELILLLRNRKTILLSNLISNLHHPLKLTGAFQIRLAAFRWRFSCSYLLIVVCTDT